MCVLYRLGKGERREEKRKEEKRRGKMRIRRGRNKWGEMWRKDERRWKEWKEWKEGNRSRSEETRRRVGKEMGGGEGRDIMKREERYMDIGGETERGREGSVGRRGFPTPRDTVCMYTCLSRVVFSCPRVVTAVTAAKTKGGNALRDIRH